MIGYYVHHRGRGHLHRAESIAAALSEPITILSSLPVSPGHAWWKEWIELAPDDCDSRVDVTARSQLHWAPLRGLGLRDRMAAIAAWIERDRPSVVVVDVSVEVAMFIRLMGVPVVVMALPGERVDLPHQTAYTIAERIIAAWRRDVYDPAWLAAYREKTLFAGSWSRYDERAPEHLAATDGRPRVLVLSGAGGTTLCTRDVAELAIRYPDYSWTSAGLIDGEWLHDPWPHICSADIVVTHAGQNAVAEVAAARRPAIVIPQDRPHGEQMALARALGDAGIAVVRPRWPEPHDWEPLLTEAISLGADGWRRWTSDNAARTAARAIADVANRGGDQWLDRR